MKYLICNFKNNLIKNIIPEYTKKIEEIEVNNLKLVLMPSYPFFSYFNPINYELGSQDISSFSNEKITGEITGEILKSFDVSYVLVGHSERRRYKNEINIDFINKINHAQENNLNVIYCIGESLEDKKRGKTYEVLEKQISEVLNNVKLKNIIIAYEPVWAIGTGINPEIKDINLTIEFIKETIKENYDCYLDVLYGGNVNVDNIEDINNIKNIDGFLIGNASLNIENVINIISKINN